MSNSCDVQVSYVEIDLIVRELKGVLGRGVEGDVVEMGCYTGDTSLVLAKLLIGSGKKLFLYDSFAGLPEKSSEDLSSVGENFRVGELLASKNELLKRFARASLPRPVVKKGWFADLLPSDLPERIAFGFLDGDYYESIRDSLRLVRERLMDGAVIIVDDYASEALPGVARAVDEWISTMHSKVVKMRVEKSLAIIRVSS